MFSNCKTAIIAANRFEARLLADLLRNAGLSDVRMLMDGQGALEDLKVRRADIVLVSVEQGPADPFGWVRALRRDPANHSRKAAVFMVSGLLTARLAEQCKHAGANAIIGTPASLATILNTIKKVLLKPRPFIEGKAYTGPCRRAGIITAGAGAKADRRQPAACHAV